MPTSTVIITEKVPEIAIIKEEKIAIYSRVSTTKNKNSKLSEEFKRRFSRRFASNHIFVLCNIIWRNKK